MLHSNFFLLFRSIEGQEPEDDETEKEKTEAEEATTATTSATTEGEAQPENELLFRTAKLNPRSWKNFFYGSEEEASVFAAGPQTTSSSDTVKNREDEGLFIPSVPHGGSIKVSQRVNTALSALL